MFTGQKKKTELFLKPDEDPVVELCRFLHNEENLDEKFVSASIAIHDFVNPCCVSFEP